MTKLMLILTIVLALLLHQKNVHSLTCRNEDGQPVDWFIVYKVPLLQKETSKLLSSGYSYAFISGPIVSEGSRVRSFFQSDQRKERPDSWELSNKLITDSSSILGQTLAPLYERSVKNSFVMYNDQPPATSGEAMMRHFLMMPMKRSAKSDVCCRIKVRQESLAGGKHLKACHADNSRSKRQSVNRQSSMRRRLATSALLSRSQLTLLPFSHSHPHLLQ